MIEDWNALWDEEEQRYRVQTRDGREVRIWTLDAQAYNTYPVRGEVRDEGRWCEMSWTLGGRHFRHRDHEHADLIPIPRKVKRWVNVYRYKSGHYDVSGSFLDKEMAERALAISARKHRHIATVPIEWEEP